MHLSISSFSVKKYKGEVSSISNNDFSQMSDIFLSALLHTDYFYGII